MTEEQTNNWELELELEFGKKIAFANYCIPTGESEVSMYDIKQFISKTISQEKEKCFKETVKAIFSGETVEYEGKFFKISNTDAFNFINLLQKK